MPGVGKRVAVIGAGGSGLAAIKSCIEDGLEVVCFEKRDDIGGLFHVQNPLPDLGLQARVYQGLVLNICKHFYCYSDFPPLKDSPYTLSSKNAKAYFDAYARHFDLRKRIQFNKAVTKVAKAEDYDSSGKWTITTVDALSKENPETHTFDGVILASGYFSKANMPSVPGQDSFKGSVAHSGLFWNSVPYHDRTVCVVGGGFSAVDLSVVLAQNAKQVYLVSRRGFWVLPLIIEGKGWEFYSCNRAFNEKTPDERVEEMERIVGRRYDHKQLGLNPEYRYAEASIANNIDEWIASGKIKHIKGHIDHLEQNAVCLKDGTKLEVDDVIFATGYDPDCPWLDAPDLFPNTKNIVENVHWQYVLPGGQSYPTLLMAGMVFTSGDLPPCAEMQARLAAAILSGKVQPPSQKEIVLWFKNEKDSVISTWGKYPAMADSYSLTLNISRIIGVYPCIDTIAKKNQKLANRCQNGPMIPAQFRLLGPHSQWEMAEKVVLDLEGKEDMIVPVS